ncbi:13318_t:CDS:1, partial [Acaulospora colombiana]
VAAFCKHVIPDKAMFTPFQVDLTLSTFTPASSPPRRNDSTFTRSSSFRLTSFLSRKNSLASSPASGTSDVAGPRIQPRESTDSGPGTAGYVDAYKVGVNLYQMTHLLTKFLDEAPVQWNDS